jgi:hypothetical protein
MLRCDIWTNPGVSQSAIGLCSAGRQRKMQQQYDGIATPRSKSMRALRPAAAT